jgi:ABC-type glycerol-3-phosphate transport system substrate-binding protein
MKKQIPGISAVALGLLLVGSPAVPAQEKAHTETTTKQTGPGPDTKTKSEWVIGTVKDYEPGKKIKIEGPGGKDFSFDLDTNARVQGTIMVGQKARVGYSKSADGVERVTVLSAASADTQPGMSGTGARSHVESEMKESRPGPDAKTKSEVVVGTVKEYEPGKKIKVTGPGDKDFSFDLDEGAGIQGTVAVGERVRVTYTKMPNGNKVTTIQPDHGSHK